MRTHNMSHPDNSSADGHRCIYIYIYMYMVAPPVPTFLAPLHPEKNAISLGETAASTKVSISSAWGARFFQKGLVKHKPPES